MYKDRLVGLSLSTAIVVAFGIGLSKCEQSPRPPVVVEDVTSVPVEKPSDGSHVGEDPVGQPEPVVPVDVQEPEPVKKPTVHKPVTVKEATPTKKKKRYVSHKVTYPRLSVPAFYPKKYWKK